jgi:acylphosphatase
MVCKQILVFGKVQGVSFRFHTVEVASKLALKGFVRNLADGRVEIVAYGEPARVSELIEWAKKGPPAARVEKIDVRDSKQVPSEEFFIRRDGGPL